MHSNNLLKYSMVTANNRNGSVKWEHNWMVLNPIFDSGVREGFQNWWYLSGILNNELATNNNMHRGKQTNKIHKVCRDL